MKDFSAACELFSNKPCSATPGCHEFDTLPGHNMAEYCCKGACGNLHKAMTMSGTAFLTCAPVHPWSIHISRCSQELCCCSEYFKLSMSFHLMSRSQRNAEIFSIGYWYLIPPKGLLCPRFKITCGIRRICHLV